MTRLMTEQVLTWLYSLEKPIKAVIATSGGGSSAGSFLFRAGSSSTLLQFSIPYSRESLCAFLQEPRHQHVNGFCSADMAERMARAAWHQSQAFMSQAASDGTSTRSMVEPFFQAVGIGCTASLRTTYEKKGPHQAFISVCRVDASNASDTSSWRRRLWHPKVRSYHLNLDKTIGRSREQEDLLVSQWLVYALAKEATVETDYDHAQDHALNAPLNELVEQFRQELTTQMTGAHDAFVETPTRVEERFDVLQSAQKALKPRCVIFLPPCSHATTRDACHGASTEPLMVQDLAFRGVILSGSFNPVHEGHIELALAAQQVYENVSGEKLPIAFELAVDNADKGVIDTSTIQSRVDQFMGNCFGKGAFPVVVSTAALFIDKARVLPNSVFVIGADTALRLVDIKYYHDDPSEMMLALHQIQLLQCRFVVAGRVDATKRFVTAQEVLAKVPVALQDLFVPLDERLYRNDMSSTEIRARANRKRKQDE